MTPAGADNEPTGPDPVRSCQSARQRLCPGAALGEAEPWGGERVATSTPPWSSHPRSWEVADVILAVSHGGQRSLGASPPSSHQPARPA